MIRRIGFAGIGLCLASASLSAQTMEMPVRKAGLWEMKMVAAGAPSMTMQHCTDAATDKQLSAMAGGASMPDCSKRDFQKTATGMTFDSVCNVAGTTMTSRGDISGDFNSAYTMKISSTRQGGPPGVPASTQMTIEAKWLGTCKADQTPGDVIMPGGMKMNIKAMQKMMPGAK